MLKNLYQHRNYLFGSLWSDFRYRYSGTMFGFYWFVLTPFLEAVLYTFVFYNLIGLRSNGARGESYVLFLLNGLFPWFAFTHLIVRGSNILNVSAIYLRRMSISTEVFIARESLIAVVSLCIYTLILFPVNLAFGNSLSYNILIMPILILFLSSFGFVITLSLAHLRVFFPDVGEILGLLVHLWRWTLPINYGFDKLPENIRSILMWNPPYYFITSFRGVFLNKQLPSLEAWVHMTIWILIFGAIGSFITSKLSDDVKDLM